jgi:CubicO group peptidase (beta-lactamase class C family)
MIQQKSKSKRRWFAQVFIFFALLLLVLFLYKPHLLTAIRYNLANVNDYTIFANRFLERGTPQPWVNAPQYNQRQPSAKLKSRLEGSKTTAFLVIQHGKIVFESYARGSNAEQISNSFSMAKTVVGLMVGMALEEGKIISLEQPVHDFLPDFVGQGREKIKIIDLLTMRSGLNWDESYYNPLSVTTEAYYGNNLPKLVSSLTPIHPPGTHFYYSSGDTELLGLVLQKATGQNLSAYASSHLWKPLGATHDASWSLDHEGGVEKAFCCLNATARDFARLGQLVLQKGNWNGQRLISSRYLERATAPTFAPDSKSNYGYQIWMRYLNGKHLQPSPAPGTRANPKLERVAFFHGILGQFIWILPSSDAVVVRLGEQDGPNLPQLCLDVAWDVLGNE